MFKIISLILVLVTVTRVARNLYEVIELYKFNKIIKEDEDFLTKTSIMVKTLNTQSMSSLKQKGISAINLVNTIQSKIMIENEKQNKE